MALLNAPSTLSFGVTLAWRVVGDQRDARVVLVSREPGPSPGVSGTSSLRPRSPGAGTPGGVGALAPRPGLFPPRASLVLQSMRVFFFSFVCFLGCLKEIKKFCFTIDSDVLRMDFLKNQNEHNGLKSVLVFFKHFEDGDAFGCAGLGLMGQLFLRR